MNDRDYEEELLLDPRYRPAVEPFGMAFREAIPLVAGQYTPGATQTSATLTFFPSDHDASDTDADI